MYDLTLYESLAVAAYRNRLSVSTHKLLSEWLNVYVYILPDDRTLNESALYIPPLDNSHASYMALWNLTQILETNYTSTEQSNIIRYIQCYMKPPKKVLIQESKTSHTQASLPFTVAPENSNSIASNLLEKVPRVKVNLSRFRTDKS